MKTIYIAEDGTQFNDKKACREYEFTKNVLPLVKANVIGYTFDGEEVPFNDDAKSWYDNSYYIVVHNDMTKEEKNYWRYELGYDMPTQKGLYRYEDDMWIDYFKESAEFENNWAPVIKKILNK